MKKQSKRIRDAVKNVDYSSGEDSNFNSDELPYPVEVPIEDVLLQDIDQEIKMKDNVVIKDVDNVDIFKTANEELSLANEGLILAQQRVDKAVKYLDSLIVEKEINSAPNQNQIDIMEYLKKQQEMRVNRANEMLGLNPRKAPIDAVSMRRRPSYPTAF